MATTNPVVPTLSDFYSTIKEKGLRVNHEFMIEFGGADAESLNLDKYTVYCNSATLPGRKIVAAPTPFYGFKFQIPVNTEYDQTWEVQVRADTNLKIRELIENWFNAYADLSRSTGGMKGLVPKSSYARVHMLHPDFFNKGGATPKISKTYRLEGVFPTGIGPITLSHESNDISTFSLTVAYQYWFDDVIGDPLGGTTGIV